MSVKKKVAALGLAAALALSAAACSTATSKTPEDIINASQEKMAAVTSMDATMVMEMSMSMGGESMDMDTTMDMSMINDPLQMKMDMSMDMGALGNQKMSMYAAGEGEAFTLYVSADGTNWQTQSVTLDDLGAYDARGSMDVYLGSADSFQADGSETLDGGEADKYTGVITGDNMEQVMTESGALDSISSLLGGSVDMSDLYAGLDDMPVTIWVDQKTGYPVRYTMDMTGVMSQIMTKTMEAMGATVEDLGGLEFTKMTITMDCFNFNGVTSIEIPEAALAAKG